MAHRIGLVMLLVACLSLAGCYHDGGADGDGGAYGEAEDPPEREEVDDGVARSMADVEEPREPGSPPGLPLV